MKMYLLFKKGDFFPAIAMLLFQGSVYVVMWVTTPESSWNPPATAHLQFATGILGGRGNILFVMSKTNIKNMGKLPDPEV